MSFCSLQGRTLHTDRVVKYPTTCVSFSIAPANDKIQQSTVSVTRYFRKKNPPSGTQGFAIRVHGQLKLKSGPLHQFLINYPGLGGKF